MQQNMQLIASKFSIQVLESQNDAINVSKACTAYLHVRIYNLRELFLFTFEFVNFRSKFLFEGHTCLKFRTRIWNVKLSN